MYTPNNLCVYIYAFSGALSGLAASGKYPINATSNDNTDSALKADAFAQAFDTAWGSGSYTNADLLQIQGCCYGVWALGRSPIADDLGGSSPSAYTSLAASLVNAVQAGTARIVAEGINPNGCGGGGSTAQSSEIVWRPGGVYGDGVVLTWAEVASAIAASKVPLTVFVDSSIESAIIPSSAGTTDCLGTTRLLSYNWALSSRTSVDLVEIEDGATLYRLREIAEGLTVQCDCLTTAALSFSTDDTDNFVLRDFGKLTTGSDAAVAIVQLAADQTWQFLCDDNAVITANSGSLVSLTSTSTLYWFMQQGSSVSGFGVVTGPAGAIVNFLHDSTVPFPGFAGWGFNGTVNETRLDLAAWAQPSSGNTGSRPVAPNLQVGQIYFDTTLQELIVWSGSEWILPPEDYWADFGDGSDGTVTFDGSTSVTGFTLNSGTKTYTQTRAVYFENATLETGVTIVQGLALAYIHVRDTFTWDGTIQANGASASGTTGGTNTSSYLGGNGGNGGTNGNGTNGQALGGGHATGGSGGAGGTSPATPGTAGTDGGAIFNGVRTSAVWLQGIGISTSIGGSGAVALVLFGGLGGGGGAGAASSGGTWNGGGGGAGAQVSGVFARNITGTGTQEAIGGNGAAATNTGGGTGEAGGGGAGGGGTCLIVTSSSSISITQTVTAGTPGAGIGGGSTGGAAANGLALVISPG